MTHLSGQGRAVYPESIGYDERAVRLESTVHRERAVLRESTVGEERAALVERTVKVERAANSESTENRERACAPVLLLTLLLALTAPALAAEQPPQRPYSCRQLDDQQRRCAFDQHCDKRVTERLTRECWRDGGRP